MMKTILQCLALLGWVNVAAAAYVVDVFFADEPTRLVSVVISGNGSGLKDYEEYISVGGQLTGPTGRLDRVGIGIRIEITSCSVSNNQATFRIEATKRSLTHQNDARPIKLGYAEQAINTTVTLQMNQWLLWRMDSETKSTSMLSEDRNALPGAAGIGIRKED
jgi:hypothetical protein